MWLGSNGARRDSSVNIKSIQTKMLLLILPFIIVILATLSSVGYYYSQKYLAISVEETAMATGLDYANRITAEIEKLQAQVEDLARIQRIATSTDITQLKRILADEHQRIGILETLLFIYPNGTGHRNNGTTDTFSDREYFKRVISNKTSYISEPLIAKSTGKISVVVATPVFFPR
jgi:methyl-accepting chemotaxis protein